MQYAELRKNLPEAKELAEKIYVLGLIIHDFENERFPIKPNLRDKVARLRVGVKKAISEVLDKNRERSAKPSKALNQKASTALRIASKRRKSTKVRRT